MRVLNHLWVIVYMKYWNGFSMKDIRNLQPLIFYRKNSMKSENQQWHDQIFIADPRVTKEHIYTLGLRCLGNFCHNNGPIFKQPLYGTE